MRHISDGLLTAVEGTLGRRPRPPREIFAKVREDYGFVHDRQVHHALARLLATGRARKVGKLDDRGRVVWDEDSGYVRR